MSTDDTFASPLAALLWFAAEAHRRKWAFTDSDTTETFDALHRIGNEMRAAYDATKAAEPSRAEVPAPGPVAPQETTQRDSGPVLPDREKLGQLVHETRLKVTAERGSRFILQPWDQRVPDQQELDMRIGEAVAEVVTAKPAAIREYRALVDEDGEQVVLIGWCAEGIGCLFQRRYDSPTLGQLIDAATEHEGEQGEQAHARVAEMAAGWDAYAAERNAEIAGTEGEK